MRRHVVVAVLEEEKVLGEEEVGGRRSIGDELRWPGLPLKDTKTKTHLR